MNLCTINKSPVQSPQQMHTDTTEQTAQHIYIYIYITHHTILVLENSETMQ